MVNFEHSSLVSSKDKNGFRHTLAIHPGRCSKSQCNETTVYKAKAKSNGSFSDHRDGSFVHAKFTDNKNVPSKDWAESEVLKAETVQGFALKFNNIMHHMMQIKPHDSNNAMENRDINIQIPQTALLDSLAWYGRSSRQKGETMLIFDIRRNHKTFISTLEPAITPRKSATKTKMRKPRSKSVGSTDISKAARVRFNSECGTMDDSLPFVIEGRPSVHCKSFRGQQCFQWDSTRNVLTDVPYKYLQAFIHHFYCHHQGRMAIDVLEGEYDPQNGYSLTVPVIHSIDYRFGTQDRGRDGIRRVIENHICSDLCHHLGEMSIDRETTTPHVRWGKRG